ARSGVGGDPDFQISTRSRRDMRDHACLFSQFDPNRWMVRPGRSDLTLRFHAIYHCGADSAETLDFIGYRVDREGPSLEGTDNYHLRYQDIGGASCGIATVTKKRWVIRTRRWTSFPTAGRTGRTLNACARNSVTIMAPTSKSPSS